MKVSIVATRTCTHRSVLERELQKLGVPFITQFVDDHPELIDKFNVRQSPLVVADGQVIFHPQGQKSLPRPSELKQLLDASRAVGTRG